MIERLWHADLKAHSAGLKVKRQEVDAIATEGVPHAKHELSLYAHITKISWFYEAGPCCRRCCRYPYFLLLRFLLLLRRVFLLPLSSASASFSSTSSSSSSSSCVTSSCSSYFSSPPTFSLPCSNIPLSLPPPHGV